MKKLISSILAVLMLVSLCAAFNVAAEEPTHTLKAIVIEKPAEDAGNGVMARFIFDLTKEECDAAGFPGEGYGYSCVWGATIGGEKTSMPGGVNHGNSGWGFDENNNFMYRVEILNDKTAAEVYEAAKNGTLWGGICNYDVHTVEAGRNYLWSAGQEDAQHPFLKANAQIDTGDGNHWAAILLDATTSEAYYAAAPVESGETEEGGETGEPTPPPQTADFSAAIVAVAVLALGATVVAVKKKH